MTNTINNKLIPETFTENLCYLAKNTVFRLSTNVDNYCPYYLQHLGDRFKIFTTKSIDTTYSSKNVTDIVTIAVFSNIEKAIQFLENSCRTVIHNQPIYD